MSVSAGLRPGPEFGGNILEGGNQGECGSVMCMSFERSDILTYLVDASIIVEDSEYQICSEGELLPMEELFFEGHLSNSWREDVVEGGCRGGRMSWREDVQGGSRFR